MWPKAAPRRRRSSRPIATAIRSGRRASSGGNPIRASSGPAFCTKASIRVHFPEGWTIENGSHRAAKEPGGRSVMVLLLVQRRRPVDRRHQDHHDAERGFRQIDGAPTTVNGLRDISARPSGLQSPLRPGARAARAPRSHVPCRRHAPVDEYTKVIGAFQSLQSFRGALPRRPRTFAPTGRSLHGSFG